MIAPSQGAREGAQGRSDGRQKQAEVGRPGLSPQWRVHPGPDLRLARDPPPLRAPAHPRHGGPQAGGQGKGRGPKHLPHLRARGLPGPRGRGHPPPPDRVRRGAPSPPALARLRDGTRRPRHGCRPRPRRSGRSTRWAWTAGFCPCACTGAPPGRRGATSPSSCPSRSTAGGAVFVYADPGHETAAGLHSWGRAHRELWHALRELGPARRGRRRRPGRQGVRAGGEGARQLDRAGPDPRPVEGLPERPPDPPRNRTDRAGHPPHGPRG